MAAALGVNLDSPSLMFTAKKRDLVSVNKAATERRTSTAVRWMNGLFNGKNGLLFLLIFFGATFV